MRQLQFTDCVEIVGEACQPFSGYKQYVSTGAVAINHISNDDIELVDYDGKPSRANLIAKSGDILFAKMMGTKKTLHLDEDTAQNIYSTGFCAVRARPTVLTDRCLYHLLTSKAFLDQKDMVNTEPFNNYDLNEIFGVNLPAMIAVVRTLHDVVQVA